ncbi:peptidylprolyl isomerase [Deinococcus petrolearius]|uniref:Peptidyl-prolyl cis-trans isomerase n=1 Tax=Deinococcus petrolearius TaxID=1751295 RepID=A0ABW1DJ86_9DEIO
MLKRLPLVLTGLSLAACAPTMPAVTRTYTLQPNGTLAATTSTPATAPAAPTPAPAADRAPAAPVTAPPANTAAGAMPGFAAVPDLSSTRVTTFARAEQVIDPARTYRAVLNTAKGDVVLELNAKAAPVAVNNFVFLALNHFYDGTRFHRVIEGFVAQGGDPQSSNPALQSQWGTGGPGYSFAAEVNNGLRFDRAGVLGMARSASLDSQGSQFYITLAPADFLSGQYTVFGQVLSGQDVVNSLTRTEGAGAGQPDVLNTVQIYVSQ